ncbi:hypothetical protein Q8F55_003600 [Vanrija albida]|uniref:Uncharacterized protein n=1 Tax=Vanrija albida TaxID=181172 RepID=A0ABR3Q4D5_9TREE
MTPPPFGRVGLAAGVGNSIVARQSATCPKYIEPNFGSTVNANYAVKFTWDPSCSIGSDKVDLRLTNPRADVPLVRVWTGVNYASGSLTEYLSPKWWNNTETAQLNLLIVKSGDSSAAWNAAAGPTFTVTYNATAAQPATPSGTGVFQSVEDSGAAKGTSKAVIAVAVVIPIVVLCILGALAFYFYRGKEKQKLQRWSQALSQHSGMEWEKGALPGERNSAYRPSSHYSRTSDRMGRPSTSYGRPSTGYGRPSTSSARPTSSVMLDNLAGAGAYGPRAFPSSSMDGPSRSSIVMPDGQVRTSRISFADGQRPRISSDSHVRPHLSSLGKSARHDAELAAAAATAAAYTSGQEIMDDERDVTNVSPTQLDGPNSFAEADMHRAAAAGRNGRRPSGGSTHHPDDVRVAQRASSSADELRHMEAAVLRRASGQPPQDDDDAQSPTTVAYGPDQMLAVYAARRAAASSPTAPTGGAAIKMPEPVAKAASNVKRFLSRKDKKVAPVVQQQQQQVAEPGSPESVPMRSYVHMNNGTASKDVVDSLPQPGPPRPDSDASAEAAVEGAPAPSTH